MKKIGIITIHKIPNHGSVLQAYALQKACAGLGYNVEIIDYLFPNRFQSEQPANEEPDDHLTLKEKFLKYAFAFSILKQRKGIQSFVKRYMNLTKREYIHPNELKSTEFDYDIYISGSDQIWSPFHCKGDTSFLLDFAPDNSIKLSYASSFGKANVPDRYISDYRRCLNRYNHLSVREESGASLVEEITGKRPEVVLDPTLLLDATQWNEIAKQKRIVKDKYILCYFLNYSFKAHPYVERIADEIHQQTGYKIVWAIRPPKRLINKHTHFEVGASPEDFLALIRDAEIVLTTSFHGTVFSLNYGRPLLSIVADKSSSDNRQVNILKMVGLESNILSIHDSIPYYKVADYDTSKVAARLSELREESMNYLVKALE